MEITLLITIGIIVGLGFALLFAKLKSLEQNRNDDQSLALLNQNIQGMQQRIDHTNRTINERLDRAAQVISAVNKELGTMSQIGSQLAQFQDFLKSPKMRGGLGEQGLRDLLSQSLPAEFIRFQYSFTTGDIVDAVIKLNAGIIPIDAKFPLENFSRYLQESNDREKNIHANAFRRDFRNRVNEISKKYILPDEGTVEFAVMYLPSESVYYEIVTNDKFRDLYEYAVREKIVVVSPSTLFYYLRTIMIGLEGQRINSMAHQILTALKAIQQETNKFGDNVRILGRHIGNAKNAMDQVQNDYLRLSQKVDTVLQIDQQHEPDQLSGGSMVEMTEKEKSH